MLLISKNGIFLFLKLKIFLKESWRNIKLKIIVKLSKKLYVKFILILFCNYLIKGVDL